MYRRQTAQRPLPVKCFLLVIVFSLATAFGQDRKPRIGEIDFYGYAGLDLKQVRAALPFREGDELSPEAISETIGRIKQAVRQVTGNVPTDVAPVCCDKRGNWMIYIGLPGNSIRTIRYNPAPRGTIRLPASVVTLYQQSMNALSEAVQKGKTDEDDSKGYGLSSYPPLRAKQLATRAVAIRHEQLVRRVLQLSSDVEQRQVAAHVLGYARQSKEQIAALVRASRDADETVRNNAVRALAVLAGANSKVAGRIPPADFIELLSSGLWTDRNKGGFLLDALSKNRDPRLLSQLRSRALESLIEMARWQVPGHAYTARILLGRMAGIEETELQQIVEAGQVDKIIDAVQAMR